MAVSLAVVGDFAREIRVLRIAVRMMNTKERRLKAACQPGDCGARGLSQIRLAEPSSRVL